MAPIAHKHLQSVSYRPSVWAAFLLLLANILLWLAFGVVVAGGLHPALPDLPVYRAALAAGAFGIAVVLAALLYFLAKHKRAAYFLTVGLLFALALVTFLDDFGWVDLAVVLVNLVPAVLLIVDRKWYLGGSPEA